ncbi:SH3BGR family protein [Abortiporus biennis]
MAPPPIQLFLTTIASQPALRQRQEFLLRVLQVKKIPFTSYDLASDEDAKKLWRRKAPADKQQLPGILVGGKLPGTFGDFEEAVEYGELDTFLRRNEEWQEYPDEKPALEAKPVGVPGAYSPAQMHPKYNTPSPQPSPLKSKSSTKPRREGDEAPINSLGEELKEFGINDVEDVTEDDLLALVEELGLGGDEASDLVKGLSGDSSSKQSEKPVAKEEAVAAEEPKKVEVKEEAKEPEIKAETEKAKEEVKEEVKEEGDSPEKEKDEIPKLSEEKKEEEEKDHSS